MLRALPRVDNVAAVWLSLVPLILTISAFMIVPGFVVGLAAGLAPLRTALPISPAVSISVIAGAGVVAPFIGVRWGLPLIFATTLLLVLVLGGARVAVEVVRRRRGTVPADTPRFRTSPTDVAVHLGLLALAAVINTWLVARDLNTPDTVSQTFDGVFHINAVEWIFRTNNASSLVCHLESPEGGVYPMGWHTLVAASMEFIHARDIVLATNATIIVVAAVVWPLGCLGLANRLFRGRRLAMVSTAFMCTTATAFPLLLVSFGVVYPNYMALAMLPGAITPLMDLFPGHDEPPAPPVIIPILILAVGGLGMTQPNSIATFLTALILLMGVWVLRAITGARQGGPDRQIRARIIVCILLTPVVLGIWIGMRPRQDIAWGPDATLGTAIGEIITSSPRGLTIMWLVAIPAVVGAVAAWKRRRLRWFVVFHGINCFLFSVAAATPLGNLRYYLVGTWYAVPDRVAALLPIGAVPLAALGMCTIADWAVGRFPRLQLDKARVRGQYRRVAYGTLVVVFTLLGPASWSMDVTLHRLEETYIIGPDSPMLSLDERTMIDMLPQFVGEDDVVAIDPSSGSVLAYGLSGTETTVKHLYFHHTPELDLLNDQLHYAATNPKVCQAVRDLGVTYVLDFPGRTINDRGTMRGFGDMASADGFEIVAKRGKAALYRVTACY